MLAITLAAGKGARMDHLTKDLPKTMIEFNKKPLLSYQMDLFKAHDIDHYVIGGYQANKLNLTLEKLIINHDFEATNMVYSMFLALDFLKEKRINQDVIVSYGDIIYNEGVLLSLLNADKEADIWLCADTNFYPYWSFRMESPLKDLESFSVNKVSGFIKTIGQPVSDLKEIEAQYIGLFKISSKFIPYLLKCYEKLIVDHDYFYRISVTEFFQWLIDHHTPNILPDFIESGWLEFDSIQDLNVYNKAKEANELQRFFRV